jgi:hypothetical protein
LPTAAGTHGLGCGRRTSGCIGAARIEALQELRVELPGGEVAERGGEVQPDQPVIALSGVVLQFGDLEPLGEHAANADVAARMLLLVDQALQSAELALRRSERRGGRLQVLGLRVSGS